MNTNRRVVFDTGTLVSAALRATSPANRAFSLALQCGVICICEQSLESLRSVLSRGEFDRYLGKRARIAFVDLLGNTAWMCLVSEADLSGTRTLNRDRRNRLLLTLARVAEAEAIVSNSEDLLARKTWRKISIVPPAEFVSWHNPA